MIDFFATSLQLIAYSFLSIMLFLRFSISFIALRI